MKIFKKFVVVLLAGLAITITSCKKDTTSPSEEETTPSSPSTPTLNKANVIALLNNLATPLETYTVDAGNLDTYYCANGTIIDIYPDAFLTQAGTIVTGVVTIEVKDILSKKDMILNNAIPVSNGQLLVSGGEVYFNATQGGQKLKINPASSVNIKVPAYSNASSQMLEFYAQGSANLSNSDLNWLTATATNTIAVDTTFGHIYYKFDTDSVRWVNCDFFYQLPGAKTSCTVNLPGNFNNSNSVVFLSMNGATILGRLNSSYTSVSQEFHSYENSIPEGVAYTISVISFDGTSYYYETQAVTMATNMIINMPALTLTTKSQIETNLNSLP